MLNNEIKIGALHLTISRGKLTFLFKHQRVEFNNVAVFREVVSFSSHLLKLMRRLKPKSTSSSSRTVITIPLETNVTLEIVCCLLTDTVISLGLCDTDLKTNVSILLIDRVVEYIDLSDGYVNEINSYPTDAGAVSAFISLSCELISSSSPVNIRDISPHVGLDNYNPIL